MEFCDRFLGLSKQTALVTVFIIGVLVSVADLCLAEPNQTMLGDEQRRTTLLGLEGEWICNIGNAKVRLHLADDNKFSLRAYPNNP